MSDKDTFWREQKEKLIELLKYDIAILKNRASKQAEDLEKVIEVIKYDKLALIDNSGTAGVGIKYLKKYCDISIDKWRAICAMHYVKELNHCFKYLRSKENL